MSRRVKGEGSFSECTIKGNKYLKYSITIGYEGDKQIRKQFYGKNKTECKKKYKEWSKKQASSSSDKITFAAQYKEWLFEDRKNKLKPSTFERYYGIYENYIKKSSLAPMKLTDITKNDMKKYFNKLSKNLPQSTVKNVYRYMKPFFVYAANEELIVKDVCIYEFSKSYEIQEEEQFILLDKTQQLKLVEGLKGDSMELVILLALCCGLRLGEILALSYKDFNFKDNTIKIYKSLKRISHINEDGTRTYEDKVMTPKTKGSNRTVPFPEFLTPLIKKQNKLKYRLYEDKFLFAKDTGFNIDTKTPNRHLKSILKKNELPNIRFHDLRGIFISNCIEAGIEPKTVQQVVGHTSINTTMNIYAKLSKDKIINDVTKVNDIFSKVSLL